MEVHNYLGNGFQEIIYQRALAYELTNEDIQFIQEWKMNIYYKDLVNPIGSKKADFLIEKKVIVELKAVILVEDSHLAQAINHLEASRFEVGLLINFGSKKLQFRRLMLNNNQKKYKQN